MRQFLKEHTAGAHFTLVLYRVIMSSAYVTNTAVPKT